MNDHICHIVLALCVLLFGSVSCSDSNSGESNLPVIDGGGSANGSLCIKWSVDQTYVKEHMKNVNLESQDGNFLGYSYVSGSRAGYSFKENALIASVLTMDQKSVKESEVTNMLVKYKYVGDINQSGVYTCIDNNTMATLSIKEIDSERYYVLGFAPMESDSYENIPLPKATTGDVSNIDAHGAKLEGRVENVSASCRVGFQYSVNKDMTDSKTVLNAGDAGSFSKSLSGLKMGTTYYYRACAVVDEIYYYGEVMSFTTEKLQTYQVGDMYPNDKSPEGVVFYVSSEGTSGKIVSLDQGYGEWDTMGFFSSRCYCTSTTDGSLNKIPTNKPFGMWVKGHGSGWYGPARDELKTLSKVLSVVNDALSKSGYNKIEGFFWSSTEDTTYYSQACIVCVAENGYITSPNGRVFSNTKDEKRSFLAVKSF